MMTSAVRGHDPLRGLDEFPLRQLPCFRVVHGHQINVAKQLQKVRPLLWIQKFIVSHAISFGFSPD